MYTYRCKNEVRLAKTKQSTIMGFLTIVFWQVWRISKWFLHDFGSCLNLHFSICHMSNCKVYELSFITDIFVKWTDNFIRLVIFMKQGLYVSYLSYLWEYQPNILYTITYYNYSNFRRQLIIQLIIFCLRLLNL